MKKKAFIIFCLLLVVLGVFSAVSAQRLDDPEYYTKIPQSKPEFYGSISECLSRIQAGLEEGNRKKANLGIYDLRWNVYQCAIYLLRTDQYDVRILLPFFFEKCGKVERRAGAVRFLGIGAPCIAAQIGCDDH